MNCRNPQPRDLYDEYYFKHYCGKFYDRTPEWTQFFGNIAEAIVRRIGPRTAMDAGCAIGLLVEALRIRGVDAHGVDISEYALAQVPPDLRPYCRPGSVTDALPRHSDLLICIEVLEHLQPAEGLRAIANICDAADDVLFSSTPEDYRELTHFNVQPPEHWAELFAIHGFVRDVDFDASFIAPWAARFRRDDAPRHGVIRAYERRFWHLWRENQDLRAVSVETRDHLATSEASLRKLEAHLAQKDAALGEVVARSKEMGNTAQRLEGELAESAGAARALSAELVDAESTIQGLKSRWRERNIAIRALIRQLRDRGAELEALRAQLSSNDRALRAQAAQLTERDGALQGALAQLVYFSGSMPWKLAQPLGRLRSVLAPPGTRRERLWEACVHRVLTVLELAASSVGRDSGAASQLNLARLRDERPSPGLPPPHREEQTNSYPAWLAANEPGAAALAAQREHSRRLPCRPLISVVMAVHDPPPAVLKDTLASLCEQTYDNWELCVADGGSQQEKIRAILEEAAASESRVRVSFLSENRGISTNLNEAIGSARGEFVAFLDHDDLLSAEALFQIVDLFNEDPAADVIYFDEDKVSEDGTVRFDAFFKPDWSPELLLSANYLAHAVIRRSLIQAVGGLDPAMDGAQDWDLAFRVSERTNRIRHIPKVLYHWRQVAGSTARDRTAKPWAFGAQLRGVEAHLERLGVGGARAAFASPGLLRVVWPTRGQKVSIIMPTRANGDHFVRCLESVLRVTTYANFEVVLVKNGDRSGPIRALVSRFERDTPSRVRVVDYAGPFNFSAANNLGATHATGDIFLFLNDDTEVLAAEWLEEMVRWAERPAIGAVGAKLLFPDGTVQHAGVVIGMEGHASHVFSGAPETEYGPFGSVNWYRNYMAVTGACMMMRRDVFEGVGGFDEAYQLVFSDVEICLRVVEAGYRVVYTPFARLRHREGASRHGAIPEPDLRTGYSRMSRLVEAGDPYFNANLSYATRIPSLRRSGEEGRTERLRRVAGIG